MIQADAIAYNVLTAKFPLSAGDVLIVAIPRSAAMRGVAIAIFAPSGSAVAVFGGESTASILGSFDACLSGDYVAVFGNTRTPGITRNFTVTVRDFGDGVKQLVFNDGPLHHYDGQEVAAVYCDSDGGLSVWTAAKSVGHFAFNATKSELMQGPDKPARDMLVKADLGVNLYRLTSGELQINSANDYVFTWNGLPIA